MKSIEEINSKTGIITFHLKKIFWDDLNGTQTYPFVVQIGS